MADDIDSLRQRAAKVARDYRAGQVTWDDFITEFSACEDELIAELVDVIEHEPKRGGYLGVSEETWKIHTDRVQQLIEKLEN